MTASPAQARGVRRSLLLKRRIKKRIRKKRS
jgi:hypothetical protein